MKVIHKLIKDTVVKAIDSETECFITFKNNSVKVLSYRWATESHSVLKFQTKIGSKSEDMLIVESFHVCSVDGKRELIEQGTILIEWEKVNHTSINEFGDRIMINIDDLEINFLEPIK